VQQSELCAALQKITRHQRWVTFFAVNEPTKILGQGLVIPEVLRPYMQGRDFLPWVKELPKGLQRKKA
jgi:hypothetical protein